MLRTTPPAIANRTEGKLSCIKHQTTLNSKAYEI
jgi:hypothetical protein